MDDGTIELDQRRFGRLLARHTALIVLCVLLGILVAAALAVSKGATYTASTQLRVASPLTLNDVIGNNTSSTTTRSGVSLQDQVAVLQSDTIRDRVQQTVGRGRSFTPSFSAGTTGEVVNISVDAKTAKLASDAAAAYNQAYLQVLAERNRPLFDAAIQQLNDSISGVNNQVLTLNRSLASATTTTLDSVRAQVSDAQNQLLQRRTELQTQLDTVQLQRGVAPSGNAAVISEPSTSRGNGYLRTSLVGGLVGLFLGLGLAALRESRSGRIVETADAESAGLPVVADIPVALPRKIRSAIAALAAGDDTAAYRGAAVTLAPPHSTDIPRRWLVTTPDATGLSAAVLAGRLARQVASLGRTVVLIDCDASAVGGRAGVPSQNGLPGLGEILRGEVALMQGLQADRSSGVSVITAGRDLNGIGEPLASPAFAAMLTALSERFDVVIVTGTPLARSADADVVAPLVDLVVVALQRNVTRRRSVAQTRRRLAPVLGDAALVAVLVGATHAAGQWRGPSGGNRAEEPAEATRKSSASSLKVMLSPSRAWATH